MIEYRALEVLHVGVRLAVSTAVLPLDLAVTSVRLLKDVEALLSELAVQLRSLRPAVAAAGEAYADEGFERLRDTVDDVRHETRAVAVVWSPLTAVRDVLLPPRPRSAPADDAARLVVPVDAPVPTATAPEPAAVGWAGRLVGGLVRPFVETPAADMDHDP